MSDTTSTDDSYYNEFKELKFPPEPFNIIQDRSFNDGTSTDRQIDEIFLNMLFVGMSIDAIAKIPDCYLESAEEAKQQLKALLAQQTAAVLQAVKDEMKQHTVPEGVHLITRNYLENTIDFKIAELQSNQDV